MNVLEAISKRRTLKVMSEESLPVKDISADVNTMIAMGGKAPFHYANTESVNKDLPSLAPWRFYVLDGEGCRKLAAHYKEQGIDGGKIVTMLQAAQSLLQVTWSPVATEGNTNFDQTNTEHIAATAAAVQNVLLTATALGYENYWSSGGTLREKYFIDLLGIPKDEALLASVFIFDSDTSGARTKTGALRDRQGAVETYSKQIVL